MKSEERNIASDERGDFGVRGLDPEIIERLKEAIREAGGNRAVAERSGVPLSTLNGALAGKNQPRVSAMAAIAAATGRSLDWLMLLDSTGVTPRPQSATTPAGRSLDLDDVELVENLSFSASAGNGALVLQDRGRMFPVRRELLQRFNLRPEHACMVEAVGTSMVPTINDRDFLIIDKSPAARELIREGEIYLFTLDNEAYIKRLRRDYGQWIMVSDNNELFPPRPVPEGEHFQIIGRVCWGARAL